MWKQTLLIAALLSGGAASAAGQAGPENTPVPAPPGPYQSSRPYLYPDGEGRDLPYYGAMQFPNVQHDRAYFGPGRYFEPEQPQAGADPRFSTRPMPPWGPARPPMRVPGSSGSPERQSGEASYQRGWGMAQPSYGRSPEGGGGP